MRSEATVHSATDSQETRANLVACGTAASMAVFAGYRYVPVRYYHVLLICIPVYSVCE